MSGRQSYKGSQSKDQGNCTAPQIQVSEEVVRERISHFEQLLQSAPEIIMDGVTVKDLRHMYLGEAYSLDLLTAQTAAYKRGDVVFLWHRDRGDEAEKWSLSGHVMPPLVKYFMEVWAKSAELTGIYPNGLSRIYGSPRGYAGGYFERA